MPAKCAWAMVAGEISRPREDGIPPIARTATLSRRWRVSLKQARALASPGPVLSSQPTVGEGGSRRRAQAVSSTARAQTHHLNARLALVRGRITRSIK